MSERSIALTHPCAKRVPASPPTAPPHSARSSAPPRGHLATRHGRLPDGGSSSRSRSRLLTPERRRFRAANPTYGPTRSPRQGGCAMLRKCALTVSLPMVTVVALLLGA